MTKSFRSTCRRLSRACIGLVFITLALALFVREIVLLSSRAEAPVNLRNLFTRPFPQQMMFVLLSWSLSSRLIRRAARGIEADERDLRMRHQADRAGDWALTLIVIAGIVVLASAPRELLGWWLAPVVLANVLVGLLITKSLVEHAALVIAYRVSPVHP